MKTGLTKKQKVTELYYNAKDPMAEIYTHDTKLKRRLTEYAEKYPQLCQLTEDDERGGLRFEDCQGTNQHPADSAIQRGTKKQCPEMGKRKQSAR